MPANRKRLPRKPSALQDEQFENLLRRAANFQKTRRKSAAPKLMKQASTVKRRRVA